MKKRNLLITGRKRKKHSSQVPVDNSKQVRNVFYIINGLLAVAGIIIILKATALYGLGITPDSIHYLGCAENLRAGKGYLDYDGTPYTHWPPLFPSLMALLSLTGIGPYVSGRIINALSFGGIIFLSGILIHQRIKSFLLAIAGTLTVFLSSTLLKDCTCLWSESVFIVLIIAFIYYITLYLEKERLRLLILAAVFAAISCLQRYAGLTAIIAGGILILFFNRKITLWKRFKHSFLFGFIAVAPLCLWIIRNRLVSKTNIGYEFGLHPDLLSWIVTSPLEDVTAWLVTQELWLPVRLIIIGFFLSVLIVAKILRRHKSSDTKIAQVSGIFSLAYAVFVISSAIVVAEANERLWSVLFVFLVLLMLTAIEAIAELLDRFIKKPPVSNFLVSGIISLWLLFYCLPIVQQTVSDDCEHGVSGVSSSFWRNAPLAGWLKNHKLDGVFFSDDPEALYFLHRIVAEPSLIKTDEITKYREKLSSVKNNYLIWYSMDYYCFSGFRRSYICDLSEIAAKFQLKPVIVLPDGGVFIIQ
jgi:hypothetical protein